MLFIFRITKLGLKWLLKAEVQQWDTYPEPTELLMIGCLTESIWTPRFKSSMSTPNTNLQTAWPAALDSMANRIQEQEGEDRIVAKPKPTTMNSAFTVSTSSSTLQNPVSSKSPGILKALCRTYRVFRWLDLFQRMIRTFGFGLRTKKVPFWAFEIGPSAGNVSISHEKCQKCVGKKRPFSDFFGVHGGPYRAKNGVRLLTNSPKFPASFEFAHCLLFCSIF